MIGLIGIALLPAIGQQRWRSFLATNWITGKTMIDQAIMMILKDVTGPTRGLEARMDDTGAKIDSLDLMIMSMFQGIESAGGTGIMIRVTYQALMISRGLLGARGAIEGIIDPVLTRLVKGVGGKVLERKTKMVKDTTRKVGRVLKPVKTKR